MLKVSKYKHIKCYFLNILHILLFFFRKFAEKQKQLSTNVEKDLKLTELLKDENHVYANNGI